MVLLRMKWCCFSCVACGALFPAATCCWFVSVSLPRGSPCIAHCQWRWHWPGALYTNRQVTFWTHTRAPLASWTVGTVHPSRLLELVHQSACVVVAAAMCQLLVRLQAVLTPLTSRSVSSKAQPRGELVHGGGMSSQQLAWGYRVTLPLYFACLMQGSNYAELAFCPEVVWCFGVELCDACPVCLIGIGFSRCQNSAIANFGRQLGSQGKGSSGQVPFYVLHTELSRLPLSSQLFSAL
jgi:hypothetical protein